VRLSPATTDQKLARKWFNSVGIGATLDGIIAKRLDLDYRSGERDGMQKIKKMRTADCVVAGFRYGSKETKTLGSLLLGLYDDDGLLHHVGFCSSIARKERETLTPRMEKLRKPVERGGGFSGRSPGGKSRWSSERSGEWESLDPKLVVEVQYDHFSGGRFRHGTKFLRWRPDKPPTQCRLDQVEKGGEGAMKLLERNEPAPRRRPGPSSQHEDAKGNPARARQQIAARRRDRV
jgi:ATP-dependent DNA ligase